MCSYLFPLRRNTVFYSLHMLQRSSTFYYLYIFFFAHLLNFMHKEGNDFTCPPLFSLAEFANHHKCIFSAPPNLFFFLYKPALLFLVTPSTHPPHFIFSCRNLPHPPNPMGCLRKIMYAKAQLMQNRYGAIIMVCVCTYRPVL